MGGTSRSAAWHPTNRQAASDTPGGQPLAELRAVADLELLEDMRQMCLDRPPADVELLGDLAVAAARGDKLGDTVLGRRERGRSAERGAAGPGAGGLEF